MRELLFHPSSGVDKIEPGVEYAAVYVRHRTRAPWGGLMRPVMVTHNPLTPEMPMVMDPGMPPDMIRFDTDVTWLSLMILGRWEDKVFVDVVPGMTITGGEGTMTWKGYAAQQLGQVLRQRALAERLTDFGIPRQPDEYIPHMNTHNAVERSLTLNYDELDKLLRAAGF